MNATQLATALREMADRLETTALPEHMDFKCEIVTHRVNDIDDLRAVSRLMPEVQADSNKGTHWIRNDWRADQIVVTAYYKAGLLGRVRHEKVVEVEHGVDVSVLKETPLRARH